MKFSSSAGTTAGVLVTLALAAPAADAAVTVRVEGGSAPIAARAAVALPAPAVTKATTCAADSGGAVLDRAVAGEWGGREFFGSQAVERIGTETYSFDQSERYWSLYVNDRFADQGLCDYTLQDGDEILLYVACGSATTGCAAGEPLDASSAPTARPGEGLRVEVRELTTTFDQNFTATTTKSPSAGATVTPSAGAAATTGADGVAVVMPAARGPQTLRITKGTRVPETLTVCVTDGRDGECGTTVCETTGDDGRCGTPDARPPVPVLIGFEDGERYAVGDVEREIFGGVTSDPSGIRSLGLSIFRRNGSKCAVYSGKRERFVRASCSKRSYFEVGTTGAFDYLLPKRLRHGRYEIALRATDAAGNSATTRARFSLR